uniref:Uncharacterized protein n=1 Tax=Rhizophora mucronata TaxID=61149 RepID=A0A2P2LXB6_RHIMU
MSKSPSHASHKSNDSRRSMGSCSHHKFMSLISLPVHYDAATDLQGRCS